MGEWKKVKLGDITTWRSGGTPPKMDKKYWKGTIPWISAKTLTSRRISNSEILITEEGLDKGSRLAKENSILLLVRGSGLFNDIPISIVESPVAFNQDIKSIEADESVIHPYYLLYWFIGNKDLLNTKLESTGIGAGKFDTDQLQNLEIELPSLEIQEKILNIARCWDNKIELNRQMNHTLEQMAQAIYKKYFVDDIDLENLPVGWSSKPLNSFLDFLEGPGIRNWQYTDEGIRFINIRLIEDGDINIKKASFISEEEANGVYKHFHLAENDMIMSSSGTLGKKAIVRKSHLPLMLNTSVIRFRPIDGFSRAYTYQYLDSNDFNDQLLSLASGSVQLNFGPMHLNQINMIIPNAKLLETYAKIANPLYDMIIANYNEIDFLKSIRDTLLPKLMSGVINVGQVPAIA